MASLIRRKKRNQPSSQINWRKCERAYRRKHKAGMAYSRAYLLPVFLYIFLCLHVVFIWLLLAFVVNSFVLFLFLPWVQVRELARQKAKLISDDYVVSTFDYISTTITCFYDSSRACIYRNRKQELICSLTSLEFPVLPSDIPRNDDDEAWKLENH